MRPYLYCGSFEDAGIEVNCCGSCHEDVDYGYELMEMFPPKKDGEEAFGSKTHAMVCCRFRNDFCIMFNKLSVKEQRAFWAKVIKLERKG